MTDTWSGGCQCGALRYELDIDAILTLICCHCRECQRQSASAFGMSLITAREGFRLTAGTPKRFQWEAASGRRRQGSFCGDCGVRLYNDDAEEGPWVSVKAGTLDDTSALRPVGQLWTRRAQPWLALPEDCLSYDGEPDSDEPLYAAWQARNRR